MLGRCWWVGVVVGVVVDVVDVVGWCGVVGWGVGWEIGFFLTRLFVLKVVLKVVVDGLKFSSAPNDLGTYFARHLPSRLAPHGHCVAAAAAAAAAVVAVDDGNPPSHGPFPRPIVAAPIGQCWF
jgi:hypothetical protein